ncbi:MAG TPA: hypothetical protein PLL77_13650 [Pyrinomonadaceae bacterium]|nr:hypothetical protein [Pyrinomonadaceae bacterium]
MKTPVPPKIEDSDLLELHIQEYVALRAEQRTRLDSANKIINYYAIILGVIVTGLVSVYNQDLSRQEGARIFNSIFALVLLILPLITAPFAFTQQNEEIIVRSIGSYFKKLKQNISTNPSFWGWEDYHVPKIKRDPPQFLTSSARASLLVFFSILSWGIFVFKYACYPWNEGCSYTPFSIRNVLLWSDLFLILLVLRISIGMFIARRNEVQRNFPGSLAEDSASLGTLAYLFRWFFFLEKEIREVEPDVSKLETEATSSTEPNKNSS